MYCGCDVSPQQTGGIRVDYEKITAHPQLPTPVLDRQTRPYARSSEAYRTTWSHGTIIVARYV